MHPSSPPTRRLLAILTGIALAALLGIGCELGFRVLGDRFGFDSSAARKYRDFALEGKVMGFGPHPYFAFARVPGDQGVNSFGFKDIPWSPERTPGTTRILCLGGSTTEGGNHHGIGGSYPRILEQVLEKRTGREFEVLNAGVSGWTSAEILVAWFLLLQDFAPDVVLFHEAVNDVAPRHYPNFRADYAHYRRSWEVPTVAGWRAMALRHSDLYAHLALRAGTPHLFDVANHPPRGASTTVDGMLLQQTRRPYERNLRTIAEHVRSLGGELVFVTLPVRPPENANDERSVRSGIDEHNQVMRDLRASAGFPLIDLARELPDKPASREIFLDLVHVDLVGNIWKAEQIAGSLLEGLLQEPAAPK